MTPQALMLLSKRHENEKIFFMAQKMQEESTINDTKKELQDIEKNIKDWSFRKLSANNVVSLQQIQFFHDQLIKRKNYQKEIMQKSEKRIEDIKKQIIYHYQRQKICELLLAKKEMMARLKEKKQEILDLDSFNSFQYFEKEDLFE